jgi:ABC-type amino acid transport substrate-binding protein
MNARHVGWILVALCVLGTLAGCREASDPWLERVQRAGLLRVGLDPSWPPFEFEDPETGEIVGLDVDLARAIGRELGVEVLLVPSGWEGLYGALFAGQFDAVVSALPYDPWRTQEARYSISYFDAGPVVVTGEGEDAVERPQDLTGRTVHVEYGSEGDVQARKWAKKASGLQIVTHDTAQEALAAAAAGSDGGGAAIVDAVSARLFIREGGALRVASEPLYEEPYVIAVHPRAESLQAAIDRALLDMRASGELAALIDRWL